MQNQGSSGAQEVQQWLQATYIQEQLLKNKCIREGVTTVVARKEKVWLKYTVFLTVVGYDDPTYI